MIMIVLHGSFSSSLAYAHVAIGQKIHVENLGV